MAKKQTGNILSQFMRDPDSFVLQLDSKAQAIFERCRQQLRRIQKNGEINEDARHWHMGSFNNQKDSLWEVLHKLQSVVYSVALQREYGGVPFDARNMKKDAEAGGSVLESVKAELLLSACDRTRGLLESNPSTRAEFIEALGAFDWSQSPSYDQGQLFDLVVEAVCLGYFWSDISASKNVTLISQAERVHSKATATCWLFLGYWMGKMEDSLSGSLKVQIRAAKTRNRQDAVLVEMQNVGIDDPLARESKRKLVDEYGVYVDTINQDANKLRKELSEETYRTRINTVRTDILC
jgi:hypothetical protein